ncbi:hypothetical protein [Paraburkholderia sp. J67]|uniref:hypothetical protein n=1 Tax=Paraburkholderia sp. J67 TaxID=2805435 RepID=UPI002ABE3755|nr:hypothetical protein [Paraburkholderia sp. J67]
MKRIILASFALFACAAAYAQVPAAAPAPSHHHTTHSKHHKARRAASTHHASRPSDSVADRAEPLDASYLKP